MTKSEFKISQKSHDAIFDRGFDSALDAVDEVIKRMKKPYVNASDIEKVMLFNQIIKELEKLRGEK